MRDAEAERLLDRLCAYFDKKLREPTRDAWLTELQTVEAEIGATSIRALAVGSTFWPSVAEFYEQVAIAREQKARERREQERREAEQDYSNLERPPLREIPGILDQRGRHEEAAQMRDFLARMEGVVDLPVEGSGTCSDCDQESGTLYRLGKFRVCANCARLRLRVRRRLADEAAGGAR